RRLRRRRGGSHRDQRQVHPTAAGSRLRSRRAGARALVHGPRGALRAVTGRAPASPRHHREVGFGAMKIEGSGALVAGGASGLGEATARRLAADGADVVICDLNEERGSALAGELDGTFVRADVTDADTVQGAVEMAAGVPGGLRISVCCAGIGWAE